MAIEIKVPVLPESVSEGTIATWYKKVGEFIKRDEHLVDIETDKVVLEVVAPEDGILEKILKEAGEPVKAQEVIAEFKAGAKDAAKESTPESTPEGTEKRTEGRREEKTKEESVPEKTQPKTENLSPSARRMLSEYDININDIQGSGKNGAILKEDIDKIVAQQKMGGKQPVRESSSSDQSNKKSTTESPAKSAAESVARRKTENAAASADESAAVKEIAELFQGERPEKRVPMTRLRARIAERLLSAQHNAAILTTFNEINMQPVMQLRQKYRENFEKTYGVRLGFMSFFTLAVIEALKHFPMVNASIDGNDIVYHGYYDIGIAVSMPRGLVVPVIRNADTLTMAEIEAEIARLSEKAKTAQLTLEEMSGGTFTISNGGVFGSLMSTPILNPPQSAILGMHKIEERPVVENGQIVIHPMMYVALSYDHRIIDGSESVRFLVTIKELLEDPARLALGI